MSDFFKLWSLEFRRQWFLIAAAAVSWLVLLGLLHLWCRTPDTEMLWIFFGGATPLIGLLLSQNMISSDFQSGTMPLLLSFPVKTWKIFAAKYLFSVAVLLLFIGAVKLILLANPPQQSDRNLLKYFRTLYLAFLFASHSILWFWSLTIRKKFALAFLLIPITILVLYPLFLLKYQWFDDDFISNPSKYYGFNCRIYFGIGLFFLTASYLQWRKIVLLKPLLRQTLYILGIYLLPAVIAALSSAAAYIHCCKQSQALERMENICTVGRFGNREDDFVLISPYSTQPFWYGVAPQYVQAYKKRKQELRQILASREFSRLPDKIGQMRKDPLYVFDHYATPGFPNRLLADILQAIPPDKKNLPLLDAIKSACAPQPMPKVYQVFYNWMDSPITLPSSLIQMRWKMLEIKRSRNRAELFQKLHGKNEQQVAAILSGQREIYDDLFLIQSVLPRFQQGVTGLYQYRILHGKYPENPMSFIPLRPDDRWTVSYEFRNKDGSFRPVAKWNPKDGKPSSLILNLSYKRYKQYKQSRHLLELPLRIPLPPGEIECSKQEKSK